MAKLSARQPSLTSPKRRTPERQGLHAWHPYYAGYSESFVADILFQFGPTELGVVLDPMIGSGTTTMVAQQRGHSAIGVELNPAMAIMARAKDATFSQEDVVIRAAEEIARQAAVREYAGPAEAATEGWIAPAAFVNLKRLEEELAGCTDEPLLPLDTSLVGLLPHQLHSLGGRTTDLLRAALLRTARRASVARDSKNPTWLKRGNGDASPRLDVFGEFREVATSMAMDLKKYFEDPGMYRRLSVVDGDAKALPLPDESIDIIITSPPYLTRIDYAVGTAPELVILGYESAEAFRGLRRSIMGSPCVAGGSYDIQATWGETCVETIRQVGEHPSKASSGYYLKMHVQYFRDAQAILRECLRVLKPGAAAILVVQDSWYKDIHIALGTIYAEMALELGAASATTIHSEVVRNHMGLVNTRARRYRKGALHEHVVLLRSA